MNNEDRTFLKQKFDEHGGTLPDALSAESIASAVRGQTQKKPARSKVVPIAASLAAVLILVVGLTAAIRFADVRVKNTADRQQADVIAQSAEETPETAAAEAQDYSALGQLLKSNMQEGAYRYYGYARNGLKGGIVYDDADMAVTAAPSAAESSMAGTVNESYSELNTRTEGVDEADEIRTDGRYIYVLKNLTNGYVGRYYGYYDYYGWLGMNTEQIGNPQRLLIVDPNGGEMSVAGEYTLSLTDPDAREVTRERTYNGFYLLGDRAVLTGTEMRFTEGKLTYNEEEQYWDVGDSFRIEYLTVVTVLDISDPAAITPVRELFFDGSLVETRITDGRLIAVTRYYPDDENFNADDYTTFVPRAGADGAYLPPGCIHVADDSASAYTMVNVTRLDGDYETASVAVLGGTEQLYVSAENVYCIGTRYEEVKNDKWDSFLTVSRVNVAGNTPVYETTGKYKDVWLLDSFAIDEYEGVLRMAVQVNAVWDGLGMIPSRAYILTLDDDLDVIGQSKSFGENENIRSVRFENEKAYVVTFLNTDPLFVFDLSDPANPVATGETKLPGFSAYLHPAGEGYMLGVGYDGTEEGITDAGKISLFDVSDPENPKEVDKYTLNKGYFDTDYKRFITVGKNGFIVTYTDWDYYGGAAAGAVYFTVEDGRIAVQSELQTPEKVSSVRALYIGDVVYLYAVRYEYTLQKDEYGYEYENAEGPYFKMYSFSLTSGEEIAQLSF